MRYRFIEEHRGNGIRIRKLCGVLEVSPSGYYDWHERPVSQREQKNQQLLVQIKEIHQTSRRTYGSPRVTEELHQRGELCGEHRVARIMRKHGIRATMKRSFKIRTTQRNFTDPVAPNLVNQRFVAEQPNKLWSSDITYLWTKEGWLYLAVVLDVYSRHVIGYALSHRLTTDIVTEAVRRATESRTVTHGLILHSDQGCQYTSMEFQRLLQSNGIQSSMSRRGNCYDNAITETFFHTLKTEHIYFEQFETRSDAELSIFEYIEVFYNRQRKHSSLGYMSPVEFEHQLTIS